jgi:hypothetical protein
MFFVDKNKANFINLSFLAFSVIRYIFLNAQQQRAFKLTPVT